MDSFWLILAVIRCVPVGILGLRGFVRSVWVIVQLVPKLPPNVPAVKLIHIFCRSVTHVLLHVGLAYSSII